jgi:DNA modification methylase
MLNQNDKKIIEMIENKIEANSSFWDFKNDDEKKHIHGILAYPAIMVPKMQSEIIDIIQTVDKNINNILDPFMGSGTVLVEGILRNLNIYGIDINPLAYLVTLVKTTPLPIDILKLKTSLLLKSINTNLEYTIHDFNNINKWFNEDVINDLSKIRDSIIKEPDVRYRRLFWISFCEIVRMSNNSQNSTFKLHIKKKDQIDSFRYDCISSFTKHLLQNINRMEEFTDTIKQNIKGTKKHLRYNKNIKIFNGDSIKLMTDKRRFRNNSIDLISTSPPYGDNHTTVTYGQYSVLPLRWIQLSDINILIDSKLIDTVSGIDRKSLGGVYYTCCFIEESGIFNLSNKLNNTYRKLLNDNEEEKARKVASFYVDFIKVLKCTSRILKPEKYAIFTVGNRRVNNEIIDFTTILEEFCDNLNLNLIYKFERNILNKRIAGKISKLKTNEAVKSMKEETVLIFRKTSLTI